MSAAQIIVLAASVAVLAAVLGGLVAAMAADMGWKVAIAIFGCALLGTAIIVAAACGIGWAVS